MWVFNLSLFLTAAWQSLSGRRIFPDYSFPYRLSLQTPQGKIFIKPLKPFNFLKIKINKKNWIHVWDFEVMLSRFGSSPRSGRLYNENLSPKYKQ